MYFGNDISSVVGSRANAALQRGKMESSLYEKVRAIRRDGLILSLLLGCMGTLRLDVVGLPVGRLLLPRALLCGQLSLEVVSKVRPFCS